MTTLIIWKEEINDTMKIVKFLGESGLVVKAVSVTIKNETREQKGGFIRILLGTLAVSFLGNMLAGKRVVRDGDRVTRIG